MNRYDHPSTTLAAPTGQCYVCNDIVPKARMVCVGPDKTKEGNYIFRCEDCHAGSPKWLKFYMHRSELRTLYASVAADFEITEAKRKERGKELAEANRIRRQEELPKQSRVAAPTKVARREVDKKRNVGRKEQRGRNVVIRRSR